MLDCKCLHGSEGMWKVGQLDTLSTCGRSPQLERVMKRPPPATKNGGVFLDFPRDFPAFWMFCQTVSSTPLLAALAPPSDPVSSVLTQVLISSYTSTITVKKLTVAPLYGVLQDLVAVDNIADTTKRADLLQTGNSCCVMTICGPADDDSSPDSKGPAKQFLFPSSKTASTPKVLSLY